MSAGSPALAPGNPRRYIARLRDEKTILDDGARPLAMEPTQVEEDELAGAATQIFVADDVVNAAQLEVSAGRDRGKTYILSAATTGVGRGIDNDVILTDIASSRRHLTIHKYDDHYELEDLGSGNGTSVNGKRIPGRVVLVSGDKIALGNTTLLFTWEGTPPPPVAPDVPLVPKDAPAGSPALSEDALVSAPPPAPRAATAGRGVRRGLIFGGLGIGLLVIAAVVVAQRAAPVPAIPAAPVQQSIAELQTTGVNAFAARQWDTALRAFEQLAIVAPTDPSVQASLARTRQERAAEQSVTQARLLAGTSPRDAITALAAVPPGSVYAHEAAALRLELSARPELARGIVPAPVLPAPPVVPTAGPTALQAPADPAVGTAEPPASSAPGEPPPSRASRAPRAGARQEPTGPAPAPARAPAVATNARVLQLFKSGRFREAADAASGVAQASTGRTADQAQSLARDIERFSQAWSGAQVGDDVATKIRNLETALRLDRTVTGGHYGSQIQPLLLRAHTDNATRSWQARRYAPACQSVQAALRLDAQNRTALGLSRDCAAKARALYEEGYGLRTTNLDRARELWRQVLQMVSRDNEFYTRAYDRLNNASTRDEDE
jgi:pSer/pThr/pTyr-binding forkhead associated (FHA) protein